MSQIKLDLKQFKHIKSDKNSTTLQHKDGHQLTIAHGPLGPEAKAQLSALSGIAKNAATPEQSDEMKHKMADGGSVMFSDKTVKKPEPPPKKEPQPHKPPQSKIKYEDKLNEKHGDIHHKLAEGGFPGDPSAPEVKKPDADNPINMLQTMLKAEGGSVDHKCEGAKFCMHCGGPLQKMADGGEVADTTVPPALAPAPDQQQSTVAAPADEAMKSAGIQPVPVSATVPGTDAQADPAVSAKRKIYNQLVTTSMGDPGIAGAPGTWHFGDDGKAPEKFKADLWQQANQFYQKFEGDKLRNAQQEGARIQADNNARQEAGLPLLPQLNAQPTQRPQAGQPGAPAQPPPIGAPFPNANQSDAMQGPEAGIAKGFQTQMEGIQGQAKAMGALGEQQAAVEQKAAASQQEAQQVFQHSYQQLEQERQAHMQDVQAGLINPDKYWTGDPATGEGGHSKVMAGIGMILAGFNPTNSPNAAINFMKYQMDKNIDAQKANLNSKQNLLAANLRQFGNLKDATDMTRIMQNDAVAHMLNANAAKAQGGPNGLAANNAKIAIGPLQRESSQLQFQMGLRHAMMKLSSGTGGDTSNTQPAEQMVNMLYQYNPEMAKQYAGRIVPGIGVSSSQQVPEDVRKTMIARKNFDQMLNKYQAFASKHSGSLNMATSNEGKALAAELQGAYRNASNGGVFKEGEQSFIEKLIPDDPTQLFASVRTNPKIKELINSNRSQLDQLKQGYGIPVQQQQAAPQYKTVGGVKYMRGPNGEAVPVK